MNPLRIAFLTHSFCHPDLLMSWTFRSPYIVSQPLMNFDSFLNFTKMIEEQRIRKFLPHGYRIRVKFRPIQYWISFIGQLLDLVYFSYHASIFSVDVMSHLPDSVWACSSLLRDKIMLLCTIVHSATQILNVLERTLTRGHSLVKVHDRTSPSYVFTMDLFRYLHWTFSVRFIPLYDNLMINSKSFST